LGVDLDDRHAGKGGLVLDLTVDFATRPGGEPAVHPTGSTSRAVEREVLENNRRLALPSELHESLRGEMQPLANTISLSASFLAE